MIRKNCANCDKGFELDDQDLGFYLKIQVPHPTHCPDCRLRRRMIFRNERTLFRRKDDASGKDILTGFPPAAQFPVYERDYWWSDAWDPMAYGKDFDESRPFLEQVKELWDTVPWASRSIINSVNSEYCDQAGYLKNCYLCFNCDYVEDSTYVLRGNVTKDSCDSLQVQSSELIYDSVLIDKSAKVYYSLDCEGSTDMWFSKQCVGCTNCFGCVNLRKKNYCIWNIQYSKEEYFKKLEEMNLGSRASIAKLKAEAQEFWKKFPSKFARGIRNVTSSGDMLGDTKNVRDSWWVTEGQDMRYCQSLYLKSADCYDFTVWGNRATRIYESLTCGEEIDNLKFCFDCWPGCRNMEYCNGCHSSSNLFGCVGLKKKEYCILNKQYTKEEYETLRAKIIEHMKTMPYVSKMGDKEISYSYGEFFPPEFSPFTFNESMLYDSFPIAKEEAVAKGYAWRDPEKKEFQTTIKGSDLPDHIKDVKDDVAKEIAECAACKRAYRIVPAELGLHRRMGVPLSDECPDCRHKKRFTFVNPPRSHKSVCDCSGNSSSNDVYTNTAVHSHGEGKCGNEFETAYGEGHILYCSDCYNAEVS